MKSGILFILAGSLIAASCTTETQFRNQVAKAIANDPSIIAQAIEKNPVQILTALQNASKNAQEALAKEKEAQDRKALEETFEKPLITAIRSDESILGPKDAPITLVEYSDFECPFCARGFGTVKELMTKYKGKIRFVYKHLPLSFHPQALISAKYYEAIRLQDENKAFAFHDEIYKNQKKLSGGVTFLDATAKSVGADLKRLKKDVESPAIAKRIDDDIREAASLGIEGTPGFVINGVPVRGAYPADHFVGIVEELKKRGKLTI
jgi:protein-disulfide isomerase